MKFAVAFLLLLAAVPRTLGVDTQPRSLEAVIVNTTTTVEDSSGPAAPSSNSTKTETAPGSSNATKTETAPVAAKDPKVTIAAPSSAPSSAPVAAVKTPAKGDSSGPGAAADTNSTETATPGKTTTVTATADASPTAASYSPSSAPSAICVATGTACSNATTADPCCGGGKCARDKDSDTGFTCEAPCTRRNKKCTSDTTCCGSLSCMDGVCDALPTCVKPNGNCTSVDIDPTALPCCWRQVCNADTGTCQAPLTCRKKAQTCGLEGQLDCCDGKVCIQGRCETETRCRKSGAWCNATAVEGSKEACCGNMNCDITSDPENPVCVQPCLRVKQKCSKNSECCGDLICGGNGKCKVKKDKTATNDNTNKTDNSTSTDGGNKNENTKVTEPTNVAVEATTNGAKTTTTKSNSTVGAS